MMAENVGPDALLFLSPFLRGEGWGEGLRHIGTRGESPSPDLLRKSTSPPKRGEVI